MQINMNRSYSSAEVIAIITQDGWSLCGVEGRYHQFKHHTKSGKVTVKHPQKDVPKGILRSILKQAGLR